MYSVLFILLGFAFLLLGLLAIPLVIEFDLHRSDELRGHVHLLWAFGLARITVFSDQDKRKPARVDKEKSGPRSGKKSGRSTPKGLTLIRQAKTRKRLIRFCQDCWHAVHKDQLRLHLRLGLDDPADTGLLWALLGPVSGWLMTWREPSVRLQPEFCGAAFVFDAVGRIRVVPLAFIRLLLGLMLSPTLWFTAFAARGTQR